MTQRSTHHTTFTVERTYRASPERVFRAWAQPEAKRAWFACHDEWEADEHHLDFRTGGRESLVMTPPGHEAHRYEAVYWDIVPNERIIYSYDMHLGDTRMSVSLATVELQPAGSGTRLVFTEQGAFLDDNHGEGREEGTRLLLESLAKGLEPS